MKLGFWNRLSVVLVIGGAFVLGTIGHFQQMHARSEVLADGYGSCMAGVGKGDQTLTPDFCWQVWQEDQWRPGWEDWLAQVGILLVVGALIYLVIRLLVAIARWVWRGREAA